MPITEEYTTESRELVVVGNLWSGSRSRHEYALKKDQSPTSLSDAKRIAGDFASLESARIRTVHCKVVETTTLTNLP